MARVAVFAYGSLVDPASAAATLGRPVLSTHPARLTGWARRWSQARSNPASEKTFAQRSDGRIPTWVLGLNVEPADSPTAPPPPPNGALIEVSAAELDRLDGRELRYERVEVGAAVDDGTVGHGFDVVFTYSATADHFWPVPPDDAVILAAYARTVEVAFAALGPGEWNTFLATTGPPPVAVVEADLVAGRIRPGNPRDW